MFQNHMMQLLALTAMEPPSELQADYVRDERCKIFRSLRPFSAEDDFRNIILGQYGPGTIDGVSVRGYREEPGVSAASMTPTFATMKVFVENWRWNGVPFYLTSGKRLGKKLTEIVIHFRTVPHSMFRNALQESVTPNILTLGIYPDETVNLTFQINSPGSKICLRSVAMDFNYNEVYSLSNLDAYERLLLDCIQGDQMLFWRQDAVELCWSFLEPVLYHCESCLDMDKRLLTYDAGTWGPEINQL
jgi:glucose-6-phosphate 1-dehydrogenase